MSDLESSSGVDTDEDSAIGVGRGRGSRRNKHKLKQKHKSLKYLGEEYVAKEGEIAYGSWARSECFKVERGLLTFG